MSNLTINLFSMTDRPERITVKDVRVVTDMLYNVDFM